MSRRKRIRKDVYSSLHLPTLRNTRRRRICALLAAGSVLAIACGTSLFLRKLSSEIAMSDAVDAVTLAVNDSVEKVMSGSAYRYEDFVKLEKDQNGNITAITTNTTLINLLSTEILQEMVNRADGSLLDIRVPLGNLFGTNLLLGKGPDIPVEIIMLTSSFIRFDNDLIATGINQSRHQIILKAAVDVDILIPWATMSTRVETDIPIADTVIIGRVPETYINTN